MQSYALLEKFLTAFKEYYHISLVLLSIADSESMLQQVFTHIVILFANFVHVIDERSTLNIGLHT